MNRKLIIYFFIFFLFVFHSISVNGQLSCTNNWLFNQIKHAGIEVGDLDVSGNTITVEALINRTTAYSGGDDFSGDIVSKHRDIFTCNYLLRPAYGCITTTNGFFVTPPVCSISLNKTYHVAMVYDGTTLKFYRNGFLMSQVACTGNLVLNDYKTMIADYAYTAGPEITPFVGYINEVRIWNVARTQAQILGNMNISLPNPSSQTGLLAYYIFDNLLNKQGNAAWNGNLVGNAAIQNSNPTCGGFIADSCAIVTVKAAFTAPDTVCVNTPVTITNTSTGATSHYWSFCQANVNLPPVGTSLGNVNSKFNLPANIDYAYDNGNYYGLLVNNGIAGGLLRLDFGNSLLNMPTAVSLGNFGGIMPDGSEGIQVVKEGTNWYAIIVGGDPLAGGTSTPRIIKADFGNSLTNTPTVTNWGNLGNMAYPHDIYLFKDANNWYGFVANFRNSTITRFSFGTNFNNPPSATNLGSFNGLLSGPTGLCPINDNGTWRLFVTNFTGNTLARLDFGNSLLNIPSGSANLGNPGGLFSSPRDIMIMNYCSQAVAFVGNDNSDVTRLNFSTLTSSPSYVNLGKIGGPGNIHSISKPFRAGADVFVFLPNSYSNNLTRFQFPGCSNSSISNAAAQTPPTFSYNAPGTYNISLTVDDGLPTQNTYCKQVVVTAPDQITITKDTSICNGDSAQLTITNAKNYLWAPATGLSNVAVANPKSSPSATTNYSVTINDKNSCTQQFAVKVSVVPVPVIIKSKDTSICLGGSAQLLASGGNGYQWSPSAGLSNSMIANPVASSVTTTRYYVQVTNNGSCMVKDSVSVTVLPKPGFAVKPAVNSICIGDSVLLTASGGDAYEWLLKTGVTNPYAAVTGVWPVNSAQYAVKITNNNCQVIDTVYSTVTVNPLPVIKLSKSGDIDCSNAAVQLTASGGAQYQWSPSTGLSGTTIPDPKVQVAQSTTYVVTVTSAQGCAASDSIRVVVTNSATMNPYLMPTAFTPNKDGLNDCFGITKWGTINQLEFSVYNRWGQMIFFTKDPSKCWDGNFKGIQQQSGVYVYKIKASTSCAEIDRSGTFVLIR